ncbi:DJ-1/PfpI family protein [Pseudonocardiaceae bacterium YIM PH 21723]|nr:DJ-1/PfpI family protein [Pseudonocardiaceae bacterium YIM PH 21723]
MTHVQLLLIDGFDPMDVVGPFEVLSAAAFLNPGALQVEFAAATGPGEVRSAFGNFRLAATTALDPAADLIIIPGVLGEDLDSVTDKVAVTAKELGPLLAPVMADPETLVAIVCGGSMLLAVAGLITGRHAVTHGMGTEALAAAGVNVVRARVVDDGDLITAGGVTSGIDLGIHLVERILGPGAALAVEEILEFERRGTVWRAA